MYVHESKSHPADDIFRGLSPSNQEKVKRWVKGPWKDESTWVNQGEKEA